MQVLIKQVGWALRSCIPNKLGVILMLLVSRPHFEEQRFRDLLSYNLLVTLANFSFLRESNPISKENWPIQILGYQDGLLWAFNSSMGSGSVGENMLLMGV